MFCLKLSYILLPVKNYQIELSKMKFIQLIKESLNTKHKNKNDRNKFLVKKTKYVKFTFFFLL